MYHIDKAWHGIHFLLTGSAWEGELPLAFIVRGGTAIGDENVGYGPARGFSPDEVKEIARALGEIKKGTLQERFDPDAMMEAEIYPCIWDRPPEDDDTLEYLVQFFGPLRQFVCDAAEAGEALLVYLN